MWLFYIFSGVLHCVLFFLLANHYERTHQTTEHTILKNTDKNDGMIGPILLVVMATPVVRSLVVGMMLHELMYEEE